MLYLIQNVNSIQILPIHLRAAKEVKKSKVTNKKPAAAPAAAAKKAAAKAQMPKVSKAPKMGGAKVSSGLR